LRKAFVAWTGLLTALLCQVSLGEAAEPARTRDADEAPASAGPGSARQLYTSGRELYLQERYAEAVSTFEAAASRESDLTDAERERLQNYLKRARVKSGSADPATDVVARGQSDDQPATAQRESRAPSESDARKILGRARQQFNAGQVLEAEKAAQTCRKLPVRWKLFGDNPEKLLEEIKECRRQEAAWKSDDASTEARKQRSNYLLARARQILEEGDAANADRLVREAEQIKVKRGLTDLKPEQLRQQLARKPSANRKAPSAVVQADAVQPAGVRQRDIRQVVADEDESPGLPVDAGEDGPPVIGKASRPAVAVAKGSVDQARAQQLLQQAQELLEAGRIDEARAKVQQAEKLDVAYDNVLALTPDYLLTRIERAERDGILARKDNKSTRPGAVSQPNGAQVATARREAKTLTDAAQADLEAGRLEDAQAKAAKAQDIDVAYDLLDKTPEDVMDKAAQMQDKRYLAKRASRSAGEPGAEPAVEELPELSADQIARTEGGENEIEDPAVVSPNGLTALDYYQRGKQAIKSGNSELATRCYLQAFQSGEKLEPRKMQEIQDYLALHRGKGRRIQLLGTRQVPENELAAAPGDEPLPRRIDQVDEQRQIALDKLRTEVRNAEFRAERLAGTNPEAALEMIDKAQSNVERSGLAAPLTGQLLKSLAKSRESIEYNRKINEPRLAQEKRNEEVRSGVKRDAENKLRIEQDFAEKVEKYNDLLKQKRFDEAIVLGKEARLLQPENPVAEIMYYKAKLAKQDDFNKNLRERKADLFTEQLNHVDEAALGYVEFIEYPKNWKELSKRRDHLKRPGSRTPSPEELKIERSLSRDVSLHFENAPLAEVIKRLASLAEVNIVLDPSGLEDEGITTNTSVSINIDGIRLKSALNLLLEPLRLGYTIKDDVLKVTSRMKQQGELLTVNYSVADLVVPIRDFGPGQGSQGMQSSGFNMGNLAYPGSSPGQMNVTSTGGLSRPAGQAFAQVDDREGARRTGGNSSFGGGLESAGTHGGGVQADFNSLMNLITTTVQPDSWEELSGPGSVMPYRTTLSLVIRQTQAVHEEIADLLGQLRRLQDLQVTVECRFITVSDNFYERIGIDFNFNLPTNVSNGLTNTFGQPLPPFGAGQVFPITSTSGTTTSGTTTSGTTTSGTTTSGTTTAGTAGGGSGPFTPGPVLDTTNYQHWPRYGAIAGLTTQKAFTSDLTIPFRQGSFAAGVPQFGGFDPNVGLNVGFAILSDIETFFLINASQGDKRNNLLFAPKITLFNGQIATVTDTVQRPFVTSLIPTVGFFSVGFQPQITVLPEGVQMTVQAVISADRRYVRLTVIPSFTAITDVQQFSFIGAAGGSTTTGSSTAGGGGQNAFGGGFGQTGFGGIGGIAAIGTATSGASTSGASTAGASGVAADQQITIQQPVFEIVSVATTVSVPDGGTVLLGGIKRLREGRVMNGVPILNKLPYISRLFKNTAVGRETESLMLMVTPRIIIQEEEEQLLGVDLPPR
jgi:general secretion pathway protein D